MAKFIIEGGNRLEGQIDVLGAKNSAMIIISACLLSKTPVVLKNVPDILDIQTELKIIEKMGVKFSRKNDRLALDGSNLKPKNPDLDLVKSMRASVVLVGALLNRFEKVSIPHPGGCTIGPRPIDLHIKAFQDLGVRVNQKAGMYNFQKTSSIGSICKFSKISVTGTENILIFAAGQKKKIVIENAAIEPEVIDLCGFLNRAGTKIKISGRKITVLGNPDLRISEYSIISDRIEAATFAILAAAGGYNLKINRIEPSHLEALFDKFRQMGLKFQVGKDWLNIYKTPVLKAVNISTSEYPGFSTDIQPPMAVLLTQTRGVSEIKENIFENRLRYLDQLTKMGAKVKIINNNRVKVFGPTKLQGTSIKTLDLRAGATLIIAALIASGKSVINNIEMIDRGYEKLEERLRKIGAQIVRVK